MVANTQDLPYATAKRANAEHIEGADLTDATLDSTRYVEIWSQKGNKKTSYAPGLGVENREFAVGYADLDIKSTPDGGTTINDAKGSLRWEIYDDPEKENLVAYSSTFRASHLRGAVAENLTDKPVMAAQAPAAGDDSYVVLAFKAQSAFDGEVISSANATEDAGLPYSRFK